MDGWLLEWWGGRVMGGGVLGWWGGRVIGSGVVGWWSGVRVVEFSLVLQIICPVD